MREIAIEITKNAVIMGLERGNNSPIKYIVCAWGVLQFKHRKGAEMENKYGITLDGKLDEQVWENLPVHTGFKKLKSRGGGPAPTETEFKVLPCEDRVYVGVKCMEPDMQELLAATKIANAVFSGNAVEVFLSPAGDSYEFYQFIVSVHGGSYTQ